MPYSLTDPIPAFSVTAGSITIDKSVFSTVGEYSIEVNSSNYASSIVTQYIKGSIIDFDWFDYNNTTVQFTFSRAVGATAITIQKSTDAGATWSIASTTGAALTASSTTAEVTNLLPNTNYKFKLVVADGIRAGNSNIVDIRTDGNMQNFAVYDYDNTAAIFTFSAPGAGTTSVAIQYSIDYGLTWVNAAVQVPITETTTQAAISGLSPNTVYIFRMYIAGGYNAGYSNWWRFTTESNLQDFASTVVTSNSASFTFTAPAGATLVKIRQYNGTVWSTSNLSSVLNAASTTATVVGLNPASDYWFQLYVEGGSYPGYSNWIFVSTASSSVSASMQRISTAPQDLELHPVLNGRQDKSIVKIKP